MEKTNFYEEKAFPIIYLISLYTTLIISLFFAKLDSTKNYTRYLSFALPQIIYIGTIVIYSQWKKVDIFKAMPTKIKIAPTKYLWAILVTIGLFSFALLPNILVSFLINSMGFGTTVTVPSMQNAGDIILGLIIICVMPAIGEEMMFRGLFASSLKNYGGIIIIIFSGLIFSMSHFSSAQTVYQLFLGILLCYIFIKTGNLIFTMLIHFLNNALALFLPSIIPFFAEFQLDGTTFAVLVPMCIMGFILLLTALRKLTDDTKKGDTDILVFEYQAEQDDFVVVGREEPIIKGKKTFLKVFFAELQHTFNTIIHTFKKGVIKKRIRRFNDHYPKRIKINNVIKIFFAIIVVMWVATIALSA